MAIVSLDTKAHIAEGIYRDKGDFSITVCTEQDVEEIIEDAKGEHRLHDERSRWHGGFNKVASIPLCVMVDLRRRGIRPQEKKKFAAWLNDPDNAVFRTRPGRV